MILEIRITVDGAGFEFAPCRPIHVDGLLSWCMVHKTPEYVPERDAEPTEIDLPLGKYVTPEGWCWKASALSPAGWSSETVRYVRRKFDESRSRMTSGKPNLVGLRYKDSNLPHDFQLCTEMVGYLDTTEPNMVMEQLKKLRYIGGGSARGSGRIAGIGFFESSEDKTCIVNGIAQRYLPDEMGWKQVRPRPEYWKVKGSCRCFVPGDEVKR